MPSKRKHQAHHGGMIDGLGGRCRFPWMVKIGTKPATGAGASLGPSVGPLGTMKPARRDEDGRAWVLATSGRTSWRGTGLTGIAGAPRGKNPPQKDDWGGARGGPTAAVMDERSEVRPEFNGGTSVGQQDKGQPRPSGNAREQSTKRAGSTSTFSNS
ncbi:hypothetical protein NEUTE1DRAFT_113123 [Neurospora tetrasperma FGSC 2508]|uniref:Uncharacterized protein n=1 Tax=Neurospora tetrasperma (strain FGSC 2508 / ATCC MYA-4615 / P0657) TaxID=510951 RepID=F8MV36_NEUT8|nr:uncharacterized protein NEUTE1DRAFT_113123 [Neurospora tetrasperma FGSC 2508]EGO54661.1 hypothetical protein NEUTE1DRAFT_113123 [Neurospora tetrasperma FGSC 2508]EGZ67867.1 hypothetical protein NEUTE2DRAFT_73483 [Neurospora tetrasperma FGSC 2509]